MKKRNVDVLIVGAGPAGLAAAIELNKSGVKNCLVVDRDSHAGGTPYFCHHSGFGLKDLHFPLSGPGYARHYAKKAIQAGIEILTETTVIDWKDATTLTLSSPRGLEQVSAKSVLLATGCRERPRSARLVPGSRPHGIFTTGSLQDFVHTYSQPVGRRAVIVGAELVSFSALVTLANAKSKAVMMVTELPKHQAYHFYRPFKWFTTTLLMRVPIASFSKLTNIYGKKRVEAVEITHLQTGKKKNVECDSVIFTGDWIPDHELARKGGLEIDPGTLGPQVDSSFRTSQKGVFAAGNLLRGAETADIAAIEGRMAAASITHYLNTEEWPQSLPFIAESPIVWVSPNSFSHKSTQTLLKNYLFRVDAFQKNVTVQVTQDNNILYSKKYRFIGPNYSAHLGKQWIAKIDFQGPAPHLRIITE